MENLDLLTHGDELERSTWATVRNWLPQYEDFWRLHLVPLRAPGSIHPRSGINEDFEFLAIYHYSAYMNLERALDRICNPADEERRFPDEIYLRLSAAAELGGKVVTQFIRIYEACLKSSPKLSSDPLEQVKNDLGDYRDLIHEQVPAVRVEDGILVIPRREKLQIYRRWTKVLYDARPEDFIPVKEQLINDLNRLCSALQDAWKRMCALSSDLVSDSEYLRRRDEGKLQLVPGWKNILTSSNTAYSPTASALIFNLRTKINED